MLIEFSVGNYLSFHEPVTLSLTATRKVSEYWDSNVIQQPRTPLLKSAVVYGANASGKSNLLASIWFMRWFIVNSSKESQIGDPIEVTPFKLDVDAVDRPSKFEMVFLVDDIRYRYGFEADREHIVHEWLFRAPKEAERMLFLREGDDIEVARAFNEGKGLESKTRPNALFLSVVANLNGELSGKIIEWFQNLKAAHGVAQDSYTPVSIAMLKDKSQRESLMNVVRRADLGIVDIDVREEKADPSFPFQYLSDEGRKEYLRGTEGRKYVTLHSTHRRYRERQPEDLVSMDFAEEESEGTMKLLLLLGPVLHCLNQGSVLVVDELEAKLHPLLTRMIVRMFHSAETNPKDAQLIFATHDTNLLHHVCFRRDQVWFTEKTRTESTDLYSLAEIKLPKGKVRKDASYERDYFRGKYGAVPYLGDFDELLRGEKADGATRQVH